VKVEPKVTTAKAFAALQPKVDEILTEAMKGFELDPSDVKSRKRIFQAFVQAGGAFFVNSEAMSLSSLRRRANQGLDFLYPKPKAQPNLTAIDGGLGEDDEAADSDDADAGDSDED
jgi:hypothetical protein